MFYIYHIASLRKIGVTEDLFDRMRPYGRPDYEILETHTCIYKVSDREIELQKEYRARFGKYKVDNTPYWKVYNMSKQGKGGKTQGPRNKESGLLDRINRLGGMATAKKTRKLTYEQAEYIRAQYKRGTGVFGNRITTRRLGKVFGVGHSQIVSIINNKSYTTP